MNETDKKFPCTVSAVEQEEDLPPPPPFTRPIVCGYCFGPKKMKSMNLVMAEASKTRLHTAALATALEEEDEYDIDDNDADSITDAMTSALTKAVLTSHDENGGCYYDDAMEEEEVAITRPDHHTTQSPYHRGLNQGHVVFTMDTGGGGMDVDGGSGSTMNLRHIVRNFQSSCSSVSNSESTGTCTMSTTGGSTVNSSGGYLSLTNYSNNTAATTPTLQATTTSSSSAGGSKTSPSSRQGAPVHQHPIRVSFVPLDPDVPLEEQHGGKMDIILHKLTEDILCLSQMQHDPAIEDDVAAAGTSDSLRKEQRAAILRVRRLTKYHEDHPGCCLVDSPLSVQTVMNRSEIAQVLDQCLFNVSSHSGIPVRSPDFTVLVPPGVSNINGNTEHNGVTRMAEQVRQAGLSFPLIIKPLVAAGTKASHSMAVLMNQDALTRVTSPCLCQEYVNHDSDLYKVYVLGDYVSVYKRRSLPNLPSSEAATASTSCCSYVEFDSQRPYPRLADFGFDQQQTSSKQKLASGSPLKQKRLLSTSPMVNAEEVQPIVVALKEAFGLELFGFDVLIASDSTSGNRQMLVVDVNYFPSYKEVPNFPALLAMYLTNRAIRSRQSSATAARTTPIKGELLSPLT